MAQDWVHLAGNHERQLLVQGPGQRGLSDEFAHAQLSEKEFDWMASLRPSLTYRPDILLCHGTPTSDVTYFLETVEPTHVRVATHLEIDARLGEARAALIVCGHTHVARSMRASRGQLIVNPGSVGLPAYEDTHPFPHAVETGSPDARYAIVEQIAGCWEAALISVSYPYRAMVELARSRQRPDWACALSSGYMT